MKMKSVSTFSLREAAKRTQFPGGEKKFASWLRSNNYLMTSNEPFQKYCDRGWFILTGKTIYKANPPFTVNVTRVTNKGLAELTKIVFDEFHKCKPCE